jgi:hypothetical protein
LPGGYVNFSVIKKYTQPTLYRESKRKELEIGIWSLRLRDLPFAPAAMRSGAMDVDLTMGFIKAVSSVWTNYRHKTVAS